MKMKKIVCAMVSAALLVSMAAATAFAVESVPSKTGTDADAGKTDVSVSGSASSEGLQVEVKTTEDSSKEETQLKGEGVEKYLTAEAVDAAAKILGTEKNAVTVSEIKEIKVSGYKTGMDKITVKVPMAALPESGTTVAVIIRVKTPNGKIVNLPLAGVVVEETVVVNGVARKVRKVALFRKRERRIFHGESQGNLKEQRSAARYFNAGTLSFRGAAAAGRRYH